MELVILLLIFCILFYIFTPTQFSKQQPIMYKELCYGDNSEIQMPNNKFKFY